MIGKLATDEAFRRRFLADPAGIEALKRVKGNKSQAAAALGLSRTRFYTLLRRYGLE